MERIEINDNESTIELYLNNNKLWGYIFDHNNVNYIDKSILKYFNFFVLSNNYTKLEDNNNYEVVLDNNTGFKHYFIDGKEDYKMFYINNGEDAVCYLKNNEEDNKNIPKIKSFKIKQKSIGKVIIAITLDALMLVSTLIPGYIVCNNMVKETERTTMVEIEPQYSGSSLDIDNYPIDGISLITLDDIKNKIFSSNGISEAEKKYLYNEDLFRDLLPLFNSSLYMRYETFYNLDNINIQNFQKDDKYGSFNGYYIRSNRNTLFVRDFDGIDKDCTEKDVISHEFMHLLQSKSGLLAEACAEIISYEYFNDSNINAYHKEVVFVRKLMETIGSKPIWNYIFTGDISLFEERVKPYLNSKEYNDLIDNLLTKPDEANLDLLNEILETLYGNIYGIDISSNTVIQLIDYENDRTINDMGSNYKVFRYYFNHHKESYYTVTEYEEKTITLKEACDRGLIVLYISELIPLSAEDEKTLLVNPNFVVVRNTDGYEIYKKEDETISFYCDIDGKHYENTSYEELQDQMISDGYGKYYLQQHEKVNYDDYKNGNYSGIIHSYKGVNVSDFSLTDDSVLVKNSLLKLNKLDSIDIVEDYFNKHDLLLNNK